MDLEKLNPEIIPGKVVLEVTPEDLQNYSENLIQKAFRAQRIHEVPIWALKVMAAIGDTMKLVGWDYPPLSSSRLKNMLASFVLDLDPIITDNLPYELENAVQITVDWMCEYGH